MPQRTATLHIPCRCQLTRRSVAPTCHATLTGGHTSHRPSSTARRAARCAYACCSCRASSHQRAHRLLSDTFAGRDSQGGSVMIASNTPPLRHGLFVTSKHMLSRNRWSIPYCLAERMMPGTMSLPFSSCQRGHSRTHVVGAGYTAPFVHSHSRLPRNCRASMSDPRTREPQ